VNHPAQRRAEGFTEGVVGLQRLKGHRFKRALAAGIQWFSHFRKHVDKINVFPVPDGDTGKNMYHAFQAALKEIETVRSNSASDIAWAAARGALIGGRGCSGMILSGFFAGFAEGVGDRHTLTADDLARAFQIGFLRARERVEHPQEGTILSVGEEAARTAAEGARHGKSVFEVIHAAWEGAQVALSKTKRQLKVLEDNHVVDAGGQGLVYFFEGLVRYSLRQPVTAAAAAGGAAVSGPAAQVPKPAPVSPFKFCTEFILSGSHLTAAQLRAALQPYGEHCMVAAGGGLFKVHIHVKDPEPVFALAAGLGSVTWRKVDDMEKQHQDTFGLEET
jgi:uncharacterized protein